MQFKNVSRASFLVQAVNILSNKCCKLALLFELGKFAMGLIRLCILKNHSTLIETIELIRIRVEEASGNDRFGAIVPLLIIKAIGTAEIGDARFCRDASATKEHRVITLFDKLFEFYLFINIDHMELPDFIKYGNQLERTIDNIVCGFCFEHFARSEAPRTANAYATGVLARLHIRLGIANKQ